MALENLPSIKGSVTVSRRSFFLDQEKIEWQVTFDVLQGGNVGSLSVDTSKLSCTSVLF